MAVTLHHVAELAGVSIKTVSNVVNDYPHVKPATRSKVLAAIEVLGYQPNLSARSLRSGKTGVIGLALPELSLSYFAELAGSVIEAAERQGMVVLIEQTGGERLREIEVLSSPRGFRLVHLELQGRSSTDRGVPEQTWSLGSRTRRRRRVPACSNRGCRPIPAPCGWRAGRRTMTTNWGGAHRNQAIGCTTP